MKILFSILLIFSSSPIIADDIFDFQIGGISIGDSLLDHMSEEHIKSHIKQTRYMYDYLNEDFGEVYMFKKIQNYEYMSFFVKPNDKFFLIYELRGFVNYIEDFNGCKKKQKEIVSKISNIFTNAKKTEQSFQSRHDPTGKSTIDKVRFKLNSGDEVLVECNNYEESLRLKNNWSEGLSVVITTKQVTDWLNGN